MSKLNPQKASAYVGPGVLRKGGKITPVPNGPLIKKKGPYAGSTLRSGGTIKKAQTGAAMTKRDSTVANIREQSRLRQNLVDFQKKVGSKPLTPELVREKDSLKGLLKDFSTKQRVKGTGLTEQQLAKNDSIYAEQQRRKKSEEDDSGQLRGMGNDKPGCSGSQRASEKRVKREARRKNGGPIEKAQLGKLVKKVVKKTSNDFIPVAEKNLTRVDAPYNKKGLNMAIERRLNPEAAKKKMTKAQRRSFEVDDSYRKNGGPVKKAKAGAMIKRADGSMSRRGLWDNLRSKAAQNKKTGAKPKSPTKAMLTQEKKIKAKAKK